MNKKIKNIVLSAMFAGLIFIATAFFKLPVPMSNGGYVHFGDALIFIAACLLPATYAFPSAAIGATLADIYVGAALWAPYTFVIKALMTLMLYYKKEKILNKRNILGMIIASFINIIGYYFAEAVITKNLITPFASVPMGLVQFFGSIIFFIVVGLSLDKANIKNRL
jgi:uncharacterized repeat protein (TIGR04002 family)